MATSDETAGYDDVQNGEPVATLAQGAARVPASAGPELKSLLGIAVFTLTVAALYFGKDVLIPITLAVMLSFLLAPIVAFLQRMRIWRVPAVIIAVLGALALLGLIGAVIGSQAASLAANAPEYAQRIQQKIQGIQGMALRPLEALTGSGASQSGTAPAAGSAGHPASDAEGGGRPPVPVKVVQESSPFAVARTVLAPILGPLETGILVFIVAIFILMQKEDLRDRFIRLFGSNDLHRTTQAMDDAGQRLSRYFLSQLAVNTCFGVVISLGLWAIGIPSSAAWGLMAGLLRFVPYIGSVLAAVAPAALGAAIDPGWTMTVEVLALFLIIEPTTGYAVEPLIYGRSTGLSPISVIIAAIFWTWVWGPTGLIISTPLTLCLVVTGRHVKHLEFFDVILGDRPALTPVEIFYQRILADNPDEALAQAETLLGDRTLIVYYDEVVCMGLKLAVEDQARGSIDPAKRSQMVHAMISVVDDLDGHVDGGSGAESAIALPANGRIMCVAGSGAFDEVVAAILAQLLRQRGADARTVTNAKVSRRAIASLDVADVDTVVISYLDVAASPAEIRYLVKRIRMRMPDARIIVGPWALGEAGPAAADIQPTIGADVFPSTLQAVIEAIATPKPAQAIAS